MSFRWPWQPRPGMVRISHKRLIELQREALRVCELEEQTRDLNRQRAVLETQARLLERGLTDAERAAAADLVADPPLTATGVLHEPALVAAVDAVVWAQRERELAGMRAGPTDMTGGQCG